MADKKISPRDASIAILKLAEELYKASPLAKAETLKKDVPPPPPPAAPSGSSATPMAQAQASMRSAFGSGPAVGKSDQAGANPDAQADAQLGEKVEQDVAQHEATNADPAHEAPMKGHIKLAKFVGAMEQKRGKHKPKTDKVM